MALLEEVEAGVLPVVVLLPDEAVPADLPPPLATATMATMTITRTTRPAAMPQPMRRGLRRLRGCCGAALVVAGKAVVVTGRMVVTVVVVDTVMVALAVVGIVS